MSITDKLLDGQASVQMNPVSNSKNGFDVELIVDNTSQGVFPTFTAACDHLVFLFEE